MENTELDSVLENLEQQKNWYGLQMHLHNGYWYPDFVLRPLLSSGEKFKALDTDVVVASQPKAGSTWIKVLVYSIVNRRHFPAAQSPLMTTSSHKMVESLECNYYGLLQKNPDLEITGGPPRLFSTHLPYQHLPTSLLSSKCKIVYITRNPLDQFISEREFLLKVGIQPDAHPLPLDQAFDMFCRGVHAFGPLWDHLAGYWKEATNSDRILFLTYEDLKQDPVSNVDRIAHFLGLSFSDEERESGVIEEIINLCSFDKLKNLQVNKTGIHYRSMPNSLFYRKGVTGDWENLLTPDMAQRFKEIMHFKMTGSGFNLDTLFKF